MGSRDDLRNRAAGEVDRYLEGEADTLTVIGRGDGVWDVLVPSYWKETVAASLALGDRSLRAEAFYMRAPEENQEGVFKLLLRRNERSYLWRFTVNEAGDASLLAEVPLASLDQESLDQLFGTLVTLVDETYRPYMELGYEGSLAEQVRAGGPGLDQPPPWAKEWEARGGAAPDQRERSSESD